MIPKIIHQTWKDEKLSKEYIKSIKGYKKIYPGYQHILWDDNKMRQFIKKYYTWFLNTYDNYKYNIQRCDSWRYFVLYHYGGIYSDLDIIPKKMISNIDKIDLLIPETQNTNLNLYKYNLTNSFLISSKNNSFMFYCMNNLEKAKNKFNFLPHIHIMYSTGPAFISLNYESFFTKKKNIILNKEYFNPGSKSLFIHTKGCSWHNWDSKMIKIINENKLFALILLIFRKKLFILILILLKKKKNI